MKRTLLVLTCIALFLPSSARNHIISPNVKTLQTVVNQEWMSMPIMTLGSDDVLNVGFDELSHTYHRFIVHIEHCEPDWSVTESLFENDWLEGFNNWPIENYENSLNTTVLYTHYSLQIPNKQCRLKMSGNYRLHILDEDNENEEVATAEFRVIEPLMSVNMEITTNTDLGLNGKYQQINMVVGFNSVRVTNFRDQIQAFVLQNGREDNMKENVAPNYVNNRELRWEHNLKFIFDGGNEYHKYEILDPTHPTMGIEHMIWNEDDRRYHAYPFTCEPRRNYLYDKDANGSFYIRNSDNFENDRISDYVLVHYKICPSRQYDSRVIINGNWTTESQDNYMMEYDETDCSYNTTILQKQGYYNYQFLLLDYDGITHQMPEEGSFFQTENHYQALIYYKGNTDRTWRLVGYKEIGTGQ